MQNCFLFLKRSLPLDFLAWRFFSPFTGDDDVNVARVTTNGEGWRCVVTSALRLGATCCAFPIIVSKLKPKKGRFVFLDIERSLCEYLCKCMISSIVLDRWDEITVKLLLLYKWSPCWCFNGDSSESICCCYDLWIINIINKFELKK